MSIFVIFFISCSQKEIDISQISMRNGLMYEVNSTSPFTGLAIKKNSNEQYLLKSSYSDGKKDGETIEYFQNGQIKLQENYSKGLMDGIKESYYENGQLTERAKYSNGILNGTYEDYYENGKPKSKIEYKDGKKNGMYEDFYKNGNPKETTVYINERIIGKYVRYFEEGNKDVEYTNTEQGFIGDYIKYNTDGSIQKHIVFDANQNKTNKGTWKRHWSFNSTLGDSPDYYYTTVTFDDKGVPTGDVFSYYTKTNKLHMQGYYSSIEPDIMDGEFKWFYDDGSIKQIGTFSNNRKNGIFETYYSKNNYSEKSRLHERIEFKDNTLDGVYEKYDSNYSREVTTMVDYKVANMGGDGRWWKVEGQCVNGKFDGTFKIWYRFREDLARQYYPVKAYAKHIWSNGILQFNAFNESGPNAGYFDTNGNPVVGGIYTFSKTNKY